MTSWKRLALGVAALIYLNEPAFAVEVIGASSASSRGSDPLNMASVCHAQFGNGVRVCQSEDIMRATAVNPLPDGTPDTPAVMYLHPTIKGVANSNTGIYNIRTADAIGFSANASGDPQCVVLQRFTHPTFGQYTTFELSTICGDARQIVCCRD